MSNSRRTISDRNDRIRSEKICKELTQKYRLYFATGKENVKEERLREPDKTRYEIYNVLRVGVPHCRCWDELRRALGRQEIEVELVRNGSTDTIQGVRFSKNGFHFNGSKVDRMFSYSKIDWQLRQNERKHNIEGRQSVAYSSGKTSPAGHNPMPQR